MSTATDQLATSSKLADGAITWISPDVDLWVASRRDAAGTHFLGFIEGREGQYVAVDGRGRSLGRFGELPVAKSSFAVAARARAGAGASTSHGSAGWRDFGARIVTLRLDG